MATTTLRAYLEELEHLLDREALEEVIGHCRHILQHFPKNIATYRVLGKALLEKGRYEEAGDVFQRILSALPDDYVSHLGMTTVGEEQSQFASAIWHLERAFEQDPHNSTLHAELKRLYERHQGSMPERIQLTRGALARIYVKGQLYDQAVAELRGALEETPERVDLLLLMAECYWNSGQEVEAGETAMRVLEILPDSMDANRILASLWFKYSRPSDAAPFITRLEQLDPFLAWQVTHPDGQEVPKNAFQLPRLDWNAKAAARLATDVPDWVGSIGNVFDSLDSGSLGGEADWLTGISPSTAAPAAPPPARKGGSGLLRGRGPDNVPAPDLGASASPPVPDWFAGVGTPSAATGNQDDVPDWFKDPVPPTLSTPDLPVPDDSQQLPSGFTDLLAGVQNAPPQVARPAQPLSSVDIPDWLQDATPEQSESAEPPAAVDAMSWLSTGPLPPLEQPESQPMEELPIADWLSESNADSVPAVEEQPTATLDSGIDWLDSMDEFLSESGTAQLGSPPDQPQGSSFEPLHEAPAPTEPAQESAPDWMSSMADLGLGAEEPAQAQPAEAGLDWLGGMDSLTSEPAAETPAEPAQESAPDWMSSMADLGLGTEEPAQTQPADTSFDWIGGVDNTKSSEAVPDSGLDWMSSPSGDNLSPDETIPVRPSGSSLDWLGSISSPGDLELEAEAPAEESSLDWLDKVGEQPAEPAPTSVPDWMSGMPDLGMTPEASEPAETSDTGPNWLREMDSLASHEPVADVSAAPASSHEFDWMNDLGELPTSEVAPEPTEPAPSAVSNLDWMGSMDAMFQETEASEPVASELAWEANAEESQPQANLADVLQELAQQPSQDTTAQDEDPLAWMQQYNISMPSVQSHLDDSEQQAAPKPLEAIDLANLLRNTPSVPSTMKEPIEAQSMVDEWATAFEPESVEQAPESPTADVGEGSWFDAMATTTPQQATPPPPTTDWLASLSSSPAPEAAVEAEGEEDVPEWMRGMDSITAPATPMNLADNDVQAAQPEEPAAEGHFTAMLRAAAQKPNEPRSPGETGVLDSSQLPDWMSAFASDTSATEASPVSAQEPEDWAAAMNAETESPTREPASAPAPLELSNDFFADLSNGSEHEQLVGEYDQEPVLENEEVESAEVPDWLAAMAPGQKAESGPSAAPLPIESLDFSALESGYSGTTSDFPDFGADEPDFVKLLDTQDSAASSVPEKPASPVAQSSTVGNTTLEAQSAMPEGSSFKFNRKPAWMRDKKPSKGGGAASPGSTGNASVADASVTPDWLNE